MAHIRIAYNGQSIRTNALLDSGATVTYLPFEIMEMLGFHNSPDLEAVDSIGAGGKFESYNATLDKLEIIKGRHSVYTFKDINVLVPKGTDAIPYPILGRDSIFKVFNITYREREEKVILRS